MHTLPKTRTSSLVTQTIGDETLIYDLNTHRAYCLNVTASAVWNACDGKKEVETFVAESGIPKELVHYSVSRLRENKLIDETVGNVPPSRQFSRRDAVALAAKFAVVLPVIGMLVAPQPIHAQSACLGFDQPFELLPIPFFPDIDACVAALLVEAATRCCSGGLNPAHGFEFGTDPQLCRGFCGAP